MFPKASGYFICALMLLIAVVSGGASTLQNRMPITSVRGGTLGRTPYDDGTKGGWVSANTTTTKKFLRETGDGVNGAIPAWDTLVAGDIPNLPASIITSGLLGLARGGTNADLSATGGTSQYVKQVSPGAAFTVGTIPAADVPGLDASKIISGVLPIANGGTGSATTSANFAFIGPTSGGAAAPSFRALVAGDIPSLDTSKLTTGTLPTTRGGTGSSLTTPAQGGVVYVNSSNVMTPLAAGTSGQVLQTNGASADPSWATITAAGSGIGAWSSAVTYATSNVVIGSDNNLYIALVSSNLNHNPTTDSGTNWALYFVSANLTLNVSSGGRFGGLVTGTNPVWTFIQNATIPSGVVLTIQFADGTYSFSAAQNLDHPFGGRIKILGNTTTPANCTLSFSGAVNGVVVDSGCTLLLFDGFKVLGTASGSNGVLANTGGVLICGTHVTASTWASGYNSSNGSKLFASSCKADTCSTAGFLANNNGLLTAVSAQSTGNAGDGFLCQQGSTLLATSSTSTGNTGWGYHAQSGNGFLSAQTVTANTNTAGNYSPAINTVGNNNSYIFQ